MLHFICLLVSPVQSSPDSSAFLPPASPSNLSQLAASFIFLEHQFYWVSVFCSRNFNGSHCDEVKFKSLSLHSRSSGVRVVTQPSLSGAV